MKLYTAERLTKLNATKAKADVRRQAKADALAARVEAMREGFQTKYADLIKRSASHMDNEFIGDVMRRGLSNCLLSEGQAAAVLAAVERIEKQTALRAASNYVGKIGERLTIAATVDRVANFERPAFNAPWTTEVVNIVTMRDAAGNAIVSKGRFYADKGASITIKATVKEHARYKDERQTIVQRVKCA